MHSVVVVGDIRTHKFKVENNFWEKLTQEVTSESEEIVPEGTYFMQQAIKTAIEIPLQTEINKRLISAKDELAKLEAETEECKKAFDRAGTDRAAREIEAQAVQASGNSWVTRATQESLNSIDENLKRLQLDLETCQSRSRKTATLIQRLEAAVSTPAQVFGLTNASAKISEYAPAGDIHHWQMEPVKLPEGTKTVGRQRYLASDPGINSLPWISPSLFKVLQDPNGLFEAKDNTNPYQVPKCPDIVVFEDRGGQSPIRNLTVNEGQGLWMDVDALSLIQDIYKAIPDAKDEELEGVIKNWNGETRLVGVLQQLLSQDELRKGNLVGRRRGLLPPSDAQLRRSICHRLVLKWAMITLFERMLQPSLESERQHRPTMEPVIICSIMGNTHTAVGDLPNIYRRILNHEWLRERTIVVLDAEDLRSGDRPLAISSGLSWERTVQETIVELKRSPEHSQLLKFGQLIVRYGVTGALHIVQRTESTHSYTLHFDVRHDDATWSDEKLKTTVFGRAGVFIASLVQSLALTCNDRHGHPFIQELSRGVSDAMFSSIGRCQTLARTSFGKSFAEFRELKQNNWLPTDLFQVKELRNPKESNQDPDALVVASSDVPSVILRNWSILGQNAQSKLGRLAREIVWHGPEVIAKGSNDLESIAAPVMRYGPKHDPSTYVVDRREVEGYRSIEIAIRSHVQRASEVQRPLSIAVFGPPGSGKSTGVKRIIAQVGEELPNQKLRVLDPFNLSQYSSVAELNKAFRKVARVKKAIPIAFFDEFDSNFPRETKKLGWLKYFLAPMEDGVFQGAKLGSAILVFAGGTADTFSEFSLEGRSRSDTQWLEFSQAKGPDFVSRLRGHLNIIGINPADPEDELYLIRRAIVVHSILKKLQKLKPAQRADIDAAMVRAILHVPEYRHGARSLRMLLESCLDHKERISISAVPPMHQLNMLVDGKAFTGLLSNLSAS